MKTTLFILFGAPGSGKGYLGDCIKTALIEAGKVRENGVSYISVGDLLRAEISAKTELGLKIEEIVNSGNLVSDELVGALVEKALVDDGKMKFLDGYPRTLQQYDDLRRMLERMNYRVITIKRDTPITLIRERVLQRRVCSTCKTTHSVNDGCCPKCGGPSIVRKDDAVIDARLLEYVKNTSPLWNYMALLSDYLLVVDGKQEASVSVQEIMRRYFK